MIKNLVISNIPNEVESLTKVLSELRDFSWTEEAKSLWSIESNGTIFYCPTAECYIWSSLHKLPANLNGLVFKDFSHIIPKGR